MRLPEVWEKQDGALVAFRSMTETELRALRQDLEDRGFVSYRDWIKSQPSEANCVGFVFDDVACASSFAIQGRPAFMEERWKEWLQVKHHGAIDAICLELSSRRRIRKTRSQLEPPCEG